MDTNALLMQLITALQANGASPAMAAPASATEKPVVVNTRAAFNELAGENWSLALKEFSIKQEKKGEANKHKFSPSLVLGLYCAAKTGPVGPQWNAFCADKADHPSMKGRSFDTYKAQVGKVAEAIDSGESFTLYARKPLEAGGFEWVQESGTMRNLLTRINQKQETVTRPLQALYDAALGKTPITKALASITDSIRAANDLGISKADIAKAVKSA